MKRLSVVAAVVLMLMMVLPRGGSALEVSISPLASCVPDCTGTTNGDMVADPQNCTNFYYCINGIPAGHPTPCPGNGHFDPDTLECGPGSDCKPACGGGSACAITCNATTTVVANPFDCTTYYFCTSGDPVLMPCSEPLLYFDGNSCTYDSSVCCPSYCTAYCDGTGFAMVPDPEDCTSYYVCDTEEGQPTPDFNFPCPDGQYFNIALGNCETGDPSSCKNLCDATGGPTASTSTTTTTSGGSGDTTTTTTTTSTGDCVTSFTCTAAGDFPACQTCQPQYFECAGAGVAGEMTICPGDNVFNPTPGLGFCAMPSNCPFT